MEHLVKQLHLTYFWQGKQPLCGKPDTEKRLNLSKRNHFRFFHNINVNLFIFSYYFCNKIKTLYEFINHIT